MFELANAKKAFSKGELEKGMELLCKKLKKKPSLEAYILYAYQLVRENRAKEALELFDEKIIPFFNGEILKLKAKRTEKNSSSINSTITSNEITVYSNYAIALWQAGNLEKAIYVTEELFEKYKNTALYGNLSYYYILSNDMEKALSVASEGISFSPDDQTILDNMGYICYVNAEYEESKRYYEKLIAANPSFPDAYYNYARTLLALGETSKARKNLERCLKCRFSALTLVKKETVEELLNSIRIG